MEYNSKNGRIEEVDFTQNENSSFILKSSGANISYQDYLQSQYGLKSSRKETFVLKDRSGACYLPQHARLTVRSDQVRDYGRILDAINTNIGDRLKRIDRLVAHLAKVDESEENKQKKSQKKAPRSQDEESKTAERKEQVRSPKIHAGFRIHKDPLYTDAVRLEYPDILFFSREGKVVKEPIHKMRWSGTGGFLNDLRPIQNWVVITDVSDARSFHFIDEFRVTYHKMRRFRHDVITRPGLRQLDFRKKENYAKSLGENNGFLLIVLPDGPNALWGSEIKARFTKVVQSSRTRRACHLQFILRGSARNKNAMIGTFEDMLAKNGNTLFRIDPKLPSEHKYIHVATFFYSESFAAINLVHRTTGTQD